MKLLDGQAITNGLRGFNAWRDDFLIELSTLMLMIGFVAGTVDVFTKGGLSTNYSFNVAWAIVQAIAIDGLFFAVWGRIAQATWSGATWLKNIMLIFVGLLLAIVATLVNGLLSYQELMSVANVKDAMATLHVDQAAFTYARSILVVLVAILVALFCRSKKAEASPIQIDASMPEADVQAMIALATQEAQTIIALAKAEATAMIAQATEEAKAMVATNKRSPRTRITEAMDSPNGQATAIPEKATSIDRSLDTIAHSPKQDGYVAIDDGNTVAIANGQGQAMMATGSHRDRIKLVMLRAMQDGKEMSYSEIAEEAGAGYSTVKKWAQTIREELESEALAVEQ